MKKNILLSLIISMILIMFTACKSGENKTIADRDGNEVIIKSTNERILSTAPSNTEILIGLGLADKIVGVDNYSPTEGLSSDVVTINFRNPDAEAIIGLDPDFIIASGHNKNGNEDPFELIKEAGIPVVYIPSSNSIEGIYEDIQFIAEVTNSTEKGRQLIDSLKKQVEEVKSIAATISSKKKVYLEISPSPNIYTTGTGTFQNEILELIGAENIFADQIGWIAASAEAVVEKNPEIIITNVSYIDNAVEEILNREGFQEIDAIKNGKVYLVDANASSRPSQNVIKAIKEIAKLVYPEYYE